MKAYIGLILIILFPLFAAAQTPVINKFYRTHKRDNGTFNMALPGLVARMGAGLARSFVEEEELKIGLRFVKKMKKIKLLVSEEECSITTGQYLQLVSEVKTNNYNELITIQEGETRINIMAREKKEKIRGLFILVKEPDSFVMLSMKTKFKIEDVNKLIEELLQEKLLKKKEEKPPVAKPRVPQA